MKREMTLPQNEGIFARQAHVAIPEGSFEREMGRAGFAGPATQIYHRNPPTAWSGITGPLAPRAFDPTANAANAGSPWDAPELLANAHLSVRFWHFDRSADHLARNGDGDQLLFIHSGSGVLFCDCGTMSFEVGDYLLLPRGAMWRLEVDGPTDILMIESTNAPFRWPDWGLIGRHAPFDAGVLERPRLDERFRDQRAGSWDVRVKRRGEISVISYPYNPLDAIGWQGDLYPLRLNVRDIRQIMSDALHLPPSSLITFESARFIISTVTPRMLETDPEAMKIPFYHNNDDCEEVLFYHEGHFLSRGGSIAKGYLTLHPSGIVHGPHPATLPYMLAPAKPRTENYAVMIDALDLIETTAASAECEIADYAMSWKDSIALAPDAKEG